jgi:hypothetical protein
MPEIPLEESVFPEPTQAAQSAVRAERRRAPIPRSDGFAVSFKAYVDKVSSICPFCGHTEKADEEDNEQTDQLKQSFRKLFTFSWNRLNHLRYRSLFSDYDDFRTDLETQ